MKILNDLITVRLHAQEDAVTRLLGYQPTKTIQATRQARIAIASNLILELAQVIATLNESD